MKQAKISFYFVLYLVVLMDFLMVISERDIAEESQRAVIDQIIEDFGKNLAFGAPDTTAADQNGTAQITFRPIGLDSIEARQVQYDVGRIQVLPGAPQNDPSVRSLFVEGKLIRFRVVDTSLKVRVDSATGRGYFNCNLRSEGVFTYIVLASGKRHVSHKLTEEMREEIMKRKKGDTATLLGKKDKWFDIKSDTVVFSVVKRGITTVPGGGF